MLPFVWPQSHSRFLVIFVCFYLSYFAGCFIVTVVSVSRVYGVPTGVMDSGGLSVVTLSSSPLTARVKLVRRRP